jgi:hypothetical protein
MVPTWLEGWLTEKEEEGHAGRRGTHKRRKKVIGVACYPYRVTGSL